MKPVPEITAEMENFRMEEVEGTNMAIVRRDPVEPVPVGTIILMAFRVTGYIQDCDGSLLAKVEHIDKDMNTTGWEEEAIGLYPECDLVVTEDEWRKLFDVPLSKSNPQDEA